MQKTRRPVGIRALLVEDDDGLRTLYAQLLRAVDGVSSVVVAEGGAEAVRVGSELHLDVAILDLNMPRVDGVEAALRLADLQPSIRIALHSSDPLALRERADGLRLPMFDKLDFDQVIEWVERQVVTALGTEASGRVSPLTRKFLVTQSVPPICSRAHAAKWGHAGRCGFPR